MKPHKHADLIKAWADGAIIQYKDYAGKWNDFEPITHASWHDNMEYRIKPEPRRIKDTYIANILLKLTIEQDGPMLTFTNVELMK